MDKKNLSEYDICTKYIISALTKASRDIHSQILKKSLSIGRDIE